MTTSRIKEKISALVSSQFPEFIQSDFPTFVEFIEAYYRFLEQDQGASELLQNARSYNDIDETTDSFVEYFLNTYVRDVPKSLFVDKKFLVKKIKDLYEAKGSGLSFKVLFKILFDESVEINVPYQNVLRASGGNWQQNFSIRVETTTGDRNDLANRIVRHTAGGVIFNTPIVRVKILTSSLTELFLDSAFLSSSYSVGDVIEVYEGSTLVFSGVIRPTIVSFKIPQPGTGFKLGQIFTINSVNGVDTLVKVTGINTSGGITNLKIISYGYGYSSPPTTLAVNLDPTKSISETTSFLLSKTQGFGSNGQVLLIDPSSPENYFLEDYTDITYTFTSVAKSFNNNVFVPFSPQQQSVPANLAIVEFTLGALAKYPGSYFTEQSFVSEFEVRIQDDELYQPFAYQTVTNVDVSDFYDIIKKLLNPAGQTFYNNRILSANIDLSARLVVTPISNIFYEAYDSFDVKDPYALDISKLFADQQTIADPLGFTLNKPITSNIASVSSVDTFSLNKTISDTANISDPYFAVVSYNREFDDTANAVVLTFNTFTKSINNNESNVSLTESGLLEVQDYFEEAFSPSAYVSELYVGNSFNII